MASLENESVGCNSVSDQVQIPKIVLKPENFSLENESTKCETLEPPELPFTDPLHVESVAHEIQSPEFVLEPDMAFLENESTGPKFVLEPDMALLENESTGPEFVLEPDMALLENESTGCDSSESAKLDSPPRTTPPLPSQTEYQITTALHPNWAEHEVQNPKFVMKPENSSLENESTELDWPPPLPSPPPLPPQTECQITDPLHPELAANKVHSPEFVLEPEKTSVENESTDSPPPPQTIHQITDTFHPEFAANGVQSPKCALETEIIHPELAASEVESPEFVLETDISHPEFAANEVESPEFVLETVISHPEFAASEVESPEFVLETDTSHPEFATSEVESPEFVLETDVSHPEFAPSEVQSPEFVLETDKLAASEVQSPEFVLEPETDSLENESTQHEASESPEIDFSLQPPPPLRPQFNFEDDDQTEPNGNGDSMQSEMDSPESKNTDEPPLKRCREEEEEEFSQQSPCFSYSDGNSMEMSDDETGAGNGTSDAELGQMVCGHCQELLSYPRGFSHVQCSCCQTVNLVLESCQVGTVYCTQCSEHLMYPFGAPSVRCATCLYVTEIGAHNLAPPLSVQLGENFPTSGTSEFDSTNGDR